MSLGRYRTGYCESLYRHSQAGCVRTEQSSILTSARYHVLSVATCDDIKEFRPNPAVMLMSSLPAVQWCRRMRKDARGT